jgi:hypothetical protein
VRTVEKHTDVVLHDPDLAGHTPVYKPEASFRSCALLSCSFQKQREEKEKGEGEGEKREKERGKGRRREVVTVLYPFSLLFVPPF